MGSYGSRTTGDKVTRATAVFTTVVSIAHKLLSALLTNEGVVCFSINCIGVGVPPSHTALIRAELLFSPSRGLRHKYTASHTTTSAREVGMTADMRAHGVGRELKDEGNVPGGLAFHTKVIDCNFILRFHNKTPFL